MNTYFRKGIFLAIIIFSFFAVFSGASVQNATSAQNCVEPPSGLVSWWSVDTISGTTVPDIKGKNNGTLERSGFTTVPGKVGNAFHSGPNGDIEIGNPANLNFGSGPFSLEVWFKWEGRRIGDSVDEIIRKSTYTGSSPGPGYWLMVLNTPQGNILEFHVGDLIDVGHAVARRATAPIVSGVWYHAVATLDRDIMKLYLNGELKSTVEMKGTPEVLDANTTSDAPFFIGGPKWGFDGFIDEVSVYNKALSQSEVKAIFNAGSAGKCKPSTTPEPTKPPVSVSPTPTKTPVVLSNITYPVAKLGDCANQQDCKTYCGTASNHSQCVAFAQKAGLVVEVPDDKKAV
ncbi:MAG: LamG domain-containing protein, partial [Patescibacteria group bacterium]